VLIGLDVTPCILSRALIELILIKNNLKLLEVDGDGALANNDTRVILDVLDLLKPDVRTNIWCFETLRRISVQNLGD